VVEMAAPAPRPKACAQRRPRCADSGSATARPQGNLMLAGRAITTRSVHHGGAGGLYPVLDTNALQDGRIFVERCVSRSRTPRNERNVSRPAIIMRIAKACWWIEWLPTRAPTFEKQNTTTPRPAVELKEAATRRMRGTVPGMSIHARRPDRRVREGLISTRFAPPADAELRPPRGGVRTVRESTR